MNKTLKQAFTLIELLVVIAIIGILSGLIVVSMGGMTTKATIAKAQIFSNSLRNSLMMNLVAEYKLDGNGNDSWGGHNGTIVGATTPSTDCIYGTCLSFNGATHIYIPNDNNAFAFNSKMTAMIWVKGESQTTKGIFTKYDNASLGWWIGTSNSKFRVIISDNGTNTSGHTKDYTSSIAVLDNLWHYVGFTFNNGTLNLYVDGVLDNNTSKSVNSAITSVYNPNVNLEIGCYLSSGSAVNNFTGLMDEARLYNEAIQASQIKEQYYAGLNKLIINGGITKEEYLSRINQTLAEK